MISCVVKKTIREILTAQTKLFGFFLVLVFSVSFFQRVVVGVKYPLIYDFNVSLSRELFLFLVFIVLMSLQKYKLFSDELSKFQKIYLTVFLIIFLANVSRSFPFILIFIYPAAGMIIANRMLPDQWPIQGIIVAKLLSLFF